MSTAETRTVTAVLVAPRFLPEGVEGAGMIADHRAGWVQTETGHAISLAFGADDLPTADSLDRAAKRAGRILLPESKLAGEAGLENVFRARVEGVRGSLKALREFKPKQADAWPQFQRVLATPFGNSTSEGFHAASQALIRRGAQGLLGGDTAFDLPPWGEAMEGATKIFGAGGSAEAMARGSELWKKIHELRFGEAPDWEEIQHWLADLINDDLRPYGRLERAAKLGSDHLRNMAADGPELRAQRGGVPERYVRGPATPTFQQLRQRAR